jgi:hypothetical protein
MPTGGNRAPTIQVASVEHIATEEVPPEDRPAVREAQGGSFTHAARATDRSGPGGTTSATTSTDLTDMIFLPLEQEPQEPGTPGDSPAR